MAAAQRQRNLKPMRLAVHSFGREMRAAAREREEWKRTERRAKLTLAFAAMGGVGGLLAGFAAMVLLLIALL